MFPTSWLICANLVRCIILCKTRSRPTQPVAHSSWSALCAPVLRCSGRSPGRAGCSMCAAIYDRSAFIIVKRVKNTGTARVLRAAQLASFCKLYSTYRGCIHLFQSSWLTITVMIERNAAICPESVHNEPRAWISARRRVRASSCCCRVVQTVHQARSPQLNTQLLVLVVVHCTWMVNCSNYLHVNDAL